MSRARLSLLLVLAMFLAMFLAPLAPAYAGWYCPDGTPCSVYHARAAARAAGSHKALHACCERRGGAAVEALAQTGSALRGEGCCRLLVSAVRTATAPQPERSLAVCVTTDALPALSVNIWTPDLPAPPLLPAHLLGYPPPPSLPTAPSRAPPMT